MERPLLFTKGLQESKEDYCGLELYLSPEKGEDTAITSELITQEEEVWRARNGNSM